MDGTSDNILTEAIDLRVAGEHFGLPGVMSVIKR
jgi:hypothetical protein